MSNNLSNFLNSDPNTEISYFGGNELRREQQNSTTGERENLLEENRPLVSYELWMEIIENLGSSLSICLISFPLVLALTFSIDDRLPNNEHIVITAGVMTIFVGFVGGFFLTGGNLIFKSFTGKSILNI